MHQRLRPRRDDARGDTRRVPDLDVAIDAGHVVSRGAQALAEPCADETARAADPDAHATKLPQGLRHR
jgi:hypothetical protein